MATPTLDPLSTQLVLNVVFAFLLEKVEQSALVPWLKQKTPKLNRTITLGHRVRPQSVCTWPLATRVK